MKKYPKKFEAWWSRADTYIHNQEMYAGARIKRIAFNAWKAGKRAATEQRESDGT